MSKVKIQGHASGTGVLTVTAPNTSTDRTITLPDETATLSTFDPDGAVTINDTGADVDFRVESDGNANMLFVDGGNNRVGIGTNAPARQFHLKDSSTYCGLAIDGNASANAAGVMFYHNGIEKAGMLWDNAAESLEIYGQVSNDTDMLRIDSSGNVGIGVTPESDIYSSRPHLRIGSMGSISATTDSTGDQMYISNNCRQISTSNAGGWKYINTDTASQYQQMGGYHEFRVASSGTADAAISWTTAMTINNSGEVGINRTTGVEKFGVKGDTNASATIIQIGTDGYRGIEFHNASDGTCGHIVLNTSSVAYNTSSDYRLKENVVPMTGSIDRLKELKPSKFNFIADADKTVDGFLAHEVSDTVPEAITGTKDAMRTEEYEVEPAIEATYDEEGNELTPAVEAVMGEREVEDYQGIDQGKLVPLLTSALQEAITKIEELTTRIEILEAN
jgi:hypothetical protein